MQAEIARGARGGRIVRSTDEDQHHQFVLGVGHGAGLGASGHDGLDIAGIDLGVRGSQCSSKRADVNGIDKRHKQAATSRALSPAGSWRGRTRKREPMAARKSMGTRKRAYSPLGRARSSGLGKNDTSNDTWTGRLSVRFSAKSPVRYQQLKRRSGEKWSGRWESNPRQ